MSADLSSFTHKFRATGDAFQQNGASKISKRNRQPLSCYPCRTRKLKCDRGHPCETCAKRNDEASCSYGKGPPPSRPDGASRGKAQDRLRQLEHLVMQMVETNNVSSRKPSTAIVSPPSSSANGDGTPKDGRLEHDSNVSKYVGSTHWSAILENIQELKTALGDESNKTPDMEEPEEVESPDHEVLFGSKRSISMQQVLSQCLPPRLQIDRRLSAYFNAKYMVIPYIHTYQFQRQYEQFWKDPLNTPPLWLSILFSICYMSAKLSQVNGSETANSEDPNSTTASFLTAAAHCLVLGGYTRPKPFVVEALSLYAQCKYMSTLDPSREVGVIFSMLIRLAYRMGYHRDPDNFSQFSVFEGEMRRRVWAMAKQFDLMVSFQLGLPNNIPVDSWDTKSPRNLLDADFNEQTTQLPPSRPEHEPTQILYFIVKSRLMVSFGRICNHALSFKNSSQSEIMALDAEVRQTYSSIPSPLRIRPMSQSFADPSYLIMVRLNCEFLHQKSLCVLHRKYMTQGFEYSTKACVDAAMAIVNCFSDIHKEFQPGGQLFNDRWMLSSFTMNDFLLAAMIMCLALSMWKKKNSEKAIQEDEVAGGYLQALKDCYEICMGQAKMSVESKKVAEALGVVLAKMQPQDAAPKVPSFSAVAASSTLSNSSSSTTMTGLTPQSQSYEMNLTPLSLNDFQFQQQPQLPTDTRSILDPYPPATVMDLSLGPFETFLDNTDNIDWTLLDQYLGNPEKFEDWPAPPPQLQNSSQAGQNQGLGQGMSVDGGNGIWTSHPVRFMGPPQGESRFDLAGILDAAAAQNGTGRSGASGVGTGGGHVQGQF